MVNKETSQFEMLYNPEFFSKLTDKECAAVLMHEFYHIIFKHVTDRAPWNTDDNETNTKVWNVATDLAIYSHLSNLPEGGLIPGEGMFADLPKGKSAEWYIPHVEQVIKEQQNKGGSSGDNESDNQEQGQGGKSPSDSNSGGSNEIKTLDDHSGWGDCPGEVKDVANERLKDIVKQAAEDASRSNSWGSVSSSTRADIMASLQTKVDWKKVLRFFVKASQRADRKNTIRRINRRYPYIHAGRKSNRVANIAVSIDQSGSVDDTMLSLFFSELNKLASIATFTVIPFDTEVDESLVYEWRKGENRKVERVMRGGTCFDAPTAYVNKGNFDGHIVLTDMCAAKPRPSKCQRMWMTTKEHDSYRYFETTERVVVVD